MTNGEVRVLALRPLRVEAQVTNGTIRLPGGLKKSAAGGSRVRYGPDQAPRLVVRILNGTLDYREEKP